VNQTHQTNKTERLNKYLAHCGLCSRREADRWIAEGRIKINGERVEKLGTPVTAHDRVEVDGKAVKPVSQYTYILYHKPRGLMCSRRDDRGRQLIYNALKVAASVQSVGRLDMDSEGLLLLTDDGAMTRKLTHPATGLPRTYRVRVGGQVNMQTLETLRKGGRDIGKGEISDPWEVVVDSESHGHTWLRVTIHRGRWREVRRTLETSGHKVRRLIRTRFGSLSLGDLPAGGWRNLKPGEVRQLQVLGSKG